MEKDKVFGLDAVPRMSVEKANVKKNASYLRLKSHQLASAS